jgi:signal transduction histidine kinase
MEIEGTAAGLPFPSIRSVCQDREGWVWAVLQDDTLARSIDGRWQAVTSDDGWPGGKATCVTADREAGVWVATKDLGLHRWHANQCQTWSRPEGLPAGSIRSLLHAGNGDLWLSFDSPSRLYRFRDGEFQPMEISGGVHALRALAEGADGTIWVGTSDGQILRVSGETLVPVPTARPEERLRSVRTLHTTPDGALWIGYAGWGLGHLIHGDYTQISKAEGLEEDHISQILSDDRGRLWLTGNQGLFEVSRADLLAVAAGRAGRARFIVHRRGSGLTSFQPVFENTPSAWRTAKGNLLFATRSGLLRVTPGRIEANPTEPPVMLERVLVDDIEVAVLGSWHPWRKPEVKDLPDPRQAGSPMVLPPDHRKLEFRFAALSFASPENVHFRHRLVGFDGNWIDSASQRSATYSRLPAGRYTFEVTACNEAGVWNEQGFRLAFSVRPFFWQTWWFRLAAAAGFSAALVGMVRYLSFRRLRRHLEQLERQAELHRERTRIARDMHDEVGAKLSRLSLLSEMASQPSLAPESFRGEIGEISETARETIRSFEDIVWAVNPRNDSLADLVDYLCRFAEELFDGTPTGCVFDVPAELPPVELPTELRHHLFLAAKEALHNVLKHARAGRVWLRVSCADQTLEIVIEDDGCGFSLDSPGTGGGNGLGNMRERMRQVHGTFEIHSKPGAGSRVVLRTEFPRGTAAPGPRV